MERKGRNDERQHPFGPCPMCGSDDIDTRTRIERFTHGDGAEAVELEAIVPVHRCVQCGFAFTGEAAEAARHAAVCHYIGVMSPEEIIGIRSRYGLSRAEFARITGIGDASLSRWENGLIIQNTGNDNLLYLLSWPDNLVRLQTKGVRRRSATERSPADQHRWRAISNEESISGAQKSAEAFELQPA